MKNSGLVITPISEIQGTGLLSPLSGRMVTIQGVVTGVSRRGFFVQDPHSSADARVSDAIYVYSPKWPALAGALLRITGMVADYAKPENGKPVTQIKLDQVKVLRKKGPAVKAFELTADNVPADSQQLAVFLNGLEGMLVSIAAGQTFIAPSNPYGDYVLTLDAEKPTEGVTRTDQGGVLIDHQNPLRWYPGFRMTDYKHAPRLNVGAKLLSRLSGPLNYRVESYQISIDQSFEIEDSTYELVSSRLTAESGSVTILTLNGFNLDVHIESKSLVKNPHQDVDDDRGDGRFISLAEAVVHQANMPDIIALQEIQDNDGAEMTTVVDASETYQILIQRITDLGGAEYRWVDIAPGVGTDGGQPGGSIRNGYLYNPERVELLENSVRAIGIDDPAYEGSRKPLLAHFREKESGKELACINVHLASKRHQNSIFAPQQPGFDAKLPIRVEQADIIADELAGLRLKGLDYYVTGDFNDTEQSETLAHLVGNENFNLVNSLPAEQRFDYNHRGKLQVLMHGIVSKTLLDRGAEYEIIHGNELLGVQPGQSGDRPSDHAYVIARLRLK